MKRPEVILGSIAFLVYSSALTWGLPDRAARERPDAWATDEIAPGGLLEEVGNTLYFRSGVYNPKYPLFGYFVQSSLAAPYYVAAAGLDTTKTRSLPYFWWIGLLARLTTVALASLIVVMGCKTYSALFGDKGAWIAGLLVALLPPAFYYGRTSNVDYPALAFTSVALWQFALILRDGLSRRSAVILGLFAALAVGTKDNQYGALIPACLFVSFTEWKRARHLVLLAGLVTVLVYIFASGLVFNLERFQQHVHFVRLGSTRHGQFYYGTHDPAWRVCWNMLEQLRQAMSPALLIASLTGCWFCARRSPRALYFVSAAPFFLLFSILPAQFVVYRFVIPIAYVLTLFAAYGLSNLPGRRLLTGGVIGWLIVVDTDFTYQMWNDSRYRVRLEMERVIRPGQSVGYYGSEPNKLPFLDPSITIVDGPTAFPAPGGPDFLIVMPWQYYDSEHEYSLPEQAYRALVSGQAGYHLWFRWQTPSLFRLAMGRGVNPSITVFSKQPLPPPQQR